MTHPRPRPGILELKPYVGGESKAAGANRVIRLASNENPLGAGARAVAAYQALASELHRYPDGGATALRDAIAAAEGLEAAQIVCGAGSDELIGLLLKSYCGPGDEVLYSRHGFMMYPIGALSVGATPVAVEEQDLTANLKAMLAAVTERTRLVFLANPNNPTGSCLGKDTVARFAASLPSDVLLVLDAAYAEYVEAADYDAGTELVRRQGNVVMLRTFSKIHGLAAVRLGWAYCPLGIADVLNRVRGPFNVSAPALAAGLAAINDKAHVEKSRAHNSRARALLAKGFQDLGLKPYPTEGNFILVRFPGKPAAAALEHLKQDGILVRTMVGYGLPDCLRFTVGLDEDNAAILASLKVFLA